MGKALLAIQPSVSASVSNVYLTPGGTQYFADATEANRQAVARIAGTFSGLGWSVNATGTGRTIRFRKNGANGNQVAAATDTTAGVYEDSSNTDAVTAGNLFDISVAETGTPTVNWIRVLFQATSNHASFMANVPGVSTNSTDSASFTLAAAGASGTNVAEAQAQTKLRTAGALKFGQVYISANGRSATTTFKSRLNGADGAISIAVGAGATGLFEDTTHSDTVASGDLWCWGYTNGIGAVGPMTLHFVGVWFENTAGAQNDLAAWNGGSVFTATAARYMSFTGSCANNATESLRTVRHGFAATASRLRLNVSANSLTGSASAKFRKNAADGNQSVTITAGATGWFEDVSSTDAFTATDDCCVSISGGTSGTCTIVGVGLTEGGGSTQTGAAAWTGDGAFTAAAAKFKMGAAAWTANGALGATGRLTGRGKAAWTATGSLSAIAIASIRASAAWTASGSFVGSGVRAVRAAAAWSGASAFTANGRLIGRARAAWSATGTLVANGGTVQLGTASWAATGVLSASGQVVRIFIGASASDDASFGGKSASQSASGWIGKTASAGANFIGKSSF